jgi:Cu/Ag efflux protein CusF
MLLACMLLAPIAAASAQQNAATRIFPATGVVTAIEGDDALTINHEPIEGLMPAMEMTFKVNPPALAKGVHPGDKVQFGVEGKTYVIRELKVVGHTQ